MLTLLLQTTCSKCKAAHEYVAAYPHLNIIVRNYLEHPLDAIELKSIMGRLTTPAISILRTSEPKFLEEYAEKTLEENDIIDILVQHPEWMQRPILVDEQNAIIGRPTELIQNYLEQK
jgi:arsenate reductase